MKVSRLDALRVFFIHFFVFMGAQLLLINSAFGLTCQTTNEYLEAMPKGQITFNSGSGETLQFEVKIAQNNQTRAAGFQYICAETIAEEPILFLFDRVLTPSFHMNNVVAPIDIAFIDADGHIESIQSMFPYVLISNHRPLYSPDRAVVAALEVHPGFFQENGINVDDLLTWQLLENRP